MSKNIPPLDLLWLVMETPESPTHVGALLLFEHPAGRPGLVREIVSAYRESEPTPPFNYVPELGLRVPRFVEAAHIDPMHHVQHLAMPAGSSYEDFLRLVAELQEPVLDRSRPLFRTWIIEGLPGRRFAIYSKVSHAIIDGASGARRIYASMSPSPRDPIPPPPFAAEAGTQRPRRQRAFAEKLAGTGAAARNQALALKDVSLGALRKTMASLSGSNPGGSQPFTAQRAPMNEPLHTVANPGDAFAAPAGDARGGPPLPGDPERRGRRARGRGRASLPSADGPGIPASPGGDVPDVAARGGRQRGGDQGVGDVRAPGRARCSHERPHRAGGRRDGDGQAGAALDVEGRGDALCRRGARPREREQCVRHRPRGTPPREPRDLERPGRTPGDVPERGAARRNLRGARHRRFDRAQRDGEFLCRPDGFRLRRQWRDDVLAARPRATRRRRIRGH